MEEGLPDLVVEVRDALNNMAATMATFLEAKGAGQSAVGMPTLRNQRPPWKGGEVQRGPEHIRPPSGSVPDVLPEARPTRSDVIMLWHEEEARSLH